MDYDCVAVFLSRCTSRGFRRSLQINPHPTLIKCGFNPAEAARLVASLSRSTFEKDKIAITFEKIAYSNVAGNTSAQDDWDS